jgi:hypothetical protein
VKRIMSAPVMLLAGCTPASPTMQDIAQNRLRQFYDKMDNEQNGYLLRDFVTCSPIASINVSSNSKEGPFEVLYQEFTGRTASGPTRERRATMKHGNAGFYFIDADMPNCWVEPRPKNLSTNW